MARTATDDVIDLIVATAGACCPAAVVAFPEPCPCHDEDGVERDPRHPWQASL